MSHNLNPTLQRSGGDIAVSVMLDPNPLDRKPPKKSQIYGGISKRLSGNPVTLPLEELIKKHVFGGHVIAPALFSGNKRSNETWLKQQVYLLDFDGEISYAQYRELCDRWRIYPVCDYPTYSHQENDNGDRFRSIFVCNEVITDKRVRDLTMALLLVMFTTRKGGPDTNCKDPARMFLGTDKKPLSLDLNQRINPIQLLYEVIKKMKADDPHHFSALKEKLCKELGIKNATRRIGVEVVEYIPETCENNKLSDLLYSQNVNSQSDDRSIVKWQNMVFSIVWQDDHTCSTKKNLQHSTPKTVRVAEQDLEQPPTSLPNLTQEDKEILMRDCLLVREFMEGSVHMHHRQRRILITNLRWRKGGIAWFRKGLESRNDYSNDKVGSQIEDAGMYSMKPEGCHNCPYRNKCRHKKNLLQQLPPRRYECRRIAPDVPRITLEETQQLLDKAVAEVYAANDKKVHLIRADVGTGKTEAMLKLPLQNTCIASPTHELNQETYTRYEKTGRDGAFIWKPRPELDKGDYAYLDLDDEGGKLPIKAVYEKVLKKELTSEATDYDPAKSLEISEYLEAIQRVHTEPLVFATQEKAMQLKQFERVIFDEDIMPRIIRFLEMKVADVQLFDAEASKVSNPSLKKTVARLRKALRATPSVVTKGIQGSTGGLHLMNGKLPLHVIEQVRGLLMADAFVRTWDYIGETESFLCVQKRAFLNNVTYTVLSGTANHFLYKAIFGHRLNLIDLPPTETMGRLLLHTRRSFSKQSIRDDQDAFVQQVIADRESYGFEGVITYKFIAAKLQGAGIPVVGTFGAMEGLDRLGGMNLAIYGTPRIPGDSLRLYADLLGLKASSEDWECAERVIERNGFDFKLYTNSGRSDLQELELSLIESELMQAVGRARLVRHACEVHVFSNLPLPGGILIEERASQADC